MLIQAVLFRVEFIFVAFEILDLLIAQPQLVHQLLVFSLPGLSASAGISGGGFLLVVDSLQLIDLPLQRGLDLLFLLL